MIQCAIPAFDGLLPEPHNKVVLTLLFRLAEWHALAKLRMHTGPTLSLLDSATSDLGQCLRQFSRTTCAFYLTRELPKEKAARERRQAQKRAKAAATTPDASASFDRDATAAPTSLGNGTSAPDSSNTHITPATEPTASTARLSQEPAKRKGPVKKSFNLWTYKIHSLGDYVKTICRYGTTDSYSTQTVSPQSRYISAILMLSTGRT